MTSPVNAPDPVDTSPEFDVEDLVIAYLSSQNLVPAGHVSARMPVELTLPFILVTRIAGGDDWIVDKATIQIDCFSADQTAASTLARAMHHKMRRLHPQMVIPFDGFEGRIYRYETEMTPVFVEFEPEGGGLIMSRYVGRYVIWVRLSTIPGY